MRNATGSGSTGHLGSLSVIFHPAAAGLQQLRELNLGWCHTVGSEDVQALSGLTRLTSLELARTRVSVAVIRFSARMCRRCHLSGLTTLELAHMRLRRTISLSDTHIVIRVHVITATDVCHSQLLVHS